MAVDRLIWRNILDFLILAALGLSLIAVKLWGEPYHRGYFADDYSLRLPYKDNTVSATILACVGFALIVVTVLIVEIIHEQREKTTVDNVLCNWIIPGWLWQSYRIIGIYIFGAACQQLTANVAKYTIGRLRPHFIDLCNPSPVNSPLNHLGYIVEFTCSNNVDPSALTDMRLSFPSAHSSFAMYTAVFWIIYIQTKAKWRGSKLLRHAVQFGILMAAWWVGLSRVVDHMHHWGDVAAGFALGAAYAFLVFIFVLKPKLSKPPDFWDSDQAQQTALPRPVTSR